jgi:broad specificity phosphatase PhoE
MHWREAIRQTFVDLHLAWPGGESSRTAMTRGHAALDALLTRPEHIVVVVPHGNLLTLILRSFEPQALSGVWSRCPPASAALPLLAAAEPWCSGMPRQTGTRRSSFMEI